MLHFEVSAGDLVYIPAGWITIEASCRNELTYGYRVAAVVPDQSQLHLLRSMVRMFEMAGKPVDAMQAILDVTGFVPQARHDATSACSWQLALVCCFLLGIFACWAAV
jgi:hypothetical protein